MITRVERLSMKVTSDSESIAQEACDSLRSKSDSRWKPRWDEMGATARDGVHHCRTHGLALPPNWAGVCKLHIDLKCSTPTCVELLTYKLCGELGLVCDTFWSMCRSSHHVSHFSFWGVCRCTYILQSKWWSWWSWGSRHVVSSPIVVVLKPPSSSLSQFFGKSER